MLRLAFGLVIGAACSSTEPRTEPPAAPQVSAAPAPTPGPAPSPADDGGLDEASTARAPASSPASGTGDGGAQAPAGGAPAEDLWAEVGEPGSRDRTMVLKIMPGPGSAVACWQGARQPRCRPAEPFRVSASDLAEIDRLWSAAVAQQPCRLTELRDGRPFVLRWRGRELAGDLPGDGSPIARYYGTECSAPHRLAEWLLRRFEGSIRAHVVRPGTPD